MPCAAAKSSMPTTPAAFSTMAPKRRAACVAMLTWSSWLAEVGMESTLHGEAMALFSATSAAAVTCAIMKPEFNPLFSTKNAGKPLIFGSTSTAVRRSDRLPISAIAMASVSAANATGSA